MIAPRRAAPVCVRAGTAHGVPSVAAMPDAHARARYPARMDDSGRRGHGEYKVPGGKLVVVDLSVADGHAERVQVSGDFFLEPDTALDALRQALVGLPAAAGEDAITAAVAAALDEGTQLYGITPGGVARAMRRALDDAAAAGGGDRP